MLTAKHFSSMNPVWVTVTSPRFQAHLIIAPAMTQSAPARRPLKSRDKGWAKAMAGVLVRLGLSPNAISVSSVFFALAAGSVLWYASPDRPSRYVLLLVIAAVAIQARLLCNLLYGMVAVEGGLQTNSGEAFNDLPGRISYSPVFLCFRHA